MEDHVSRAPVSLRVAKCIYVYTNMYIMYIYIYMINDSLILSNFNIPMAGFRPVSQPCFIQS